MIPSKVRAGLECIGQTARQRSTEHCEKCPYSRETDCHAAIAKDALEYMREVEALQKLAPIDNSRKRVGWLYTVYDEVAEDYICKDKPSRECALLMGYISTQGFVDLYHRSNDKDGEPTGFAITRRKGNITSGKRKKKIPPAHPTMSYTISTLDGHVVLKNVTSEEAAQELGVSVTTLYKRMGRHMPGEKQDSMVYHDRIIVRVPKGRKENAV